MAAPWEKYRTPSPQTPQASGVLGTIPGRVDPYRVEDQQFQRDAAKRQAAEFDYRRERDRIQDVKDAAKVAKIPPEKLAELKGQREALAGFGRLVDELDQQFQQKLDGRDRGGILGMGGERNVGGYLPNIVRPENKTFNDAADSLIGAIASAQGATGGEMNSLAEMRARFGPLIPNASDSDENIRLKLDRLRKMAADQRTAVDAQLGVESDARKEDRRAEPPPPVGEQIYEGGAPQAMELNDGGPQTVDDPVLAGVNANINSMLKSGRPIREIAQYLESVGIPQRAVNLQEIARWRKANPGYKGDWTVNVDDKMVPMSGFRSAIADVANSPVAAGVVASANTLTGNHLDNIIEAGGGNGELANIGMDALRAQNPKASFAGDIVGGVGLLAGGRGLLNLAGRGAPAATGTFAPRAIAGDAAMGAYVGSGADGTNAFSPSSALIGAASGAAGGVAGRGVINTTARALSPTGGQLAPAYAEGVQPTMGQRMGGVVDRAEQAFSSIPMVGGIQRSARNNAVEQWQAGAYNQALREIGTQLPKGVRTGTAAAAYLQRSFNKAYDEARSGLTFRQDDAFNADFSELVKNEVATLGSDGQRIFKSFVDRGSNLIKARGGTLSGQDYKNLVSRIEAKVRGLRKSPSGDTELADALEGLSIALDKGARRHSPAESIAKLDAADRGYVSAVLIEQAGAKPGSDFGEFTGKQLESAIRANSGRRSRQALRGEAPLQNYAAAGVRLGNNVPDSGTLERLMAAGGVAGVANFIDPVALTPWLANTLANLPGGRQAVNMMIAPNRKALDPARRRLMERAYLGGLLAAPTAQAATAE